MSKRAPKRLTLADQLRKMIRDSGKTVNAVAVESGIAQPVLYRFVTGERDLTLSTVQRLADHFGLELRRRK
jgi:plasmid maintenance system antidote protein VapI